MLRVPRWLLLGHLGWLDSAEAAVGMRVLIWAAGHAGGLPRGRREQQQLPPLQVEPGRADERPAVAQGAGAGGHRASHRGRRGRDWGGGAAPREQREVTWGHKQRQCCVNVCCGAGAATLFLELLPWKPGRKARLVPAEGGMQRGTLLGTEGGGPVSQQAPKGVERILEPRPRPLYPLWFLPKRLVLQLRAKPG